jgi:Leucine zipper with capping helix domain
MAQKTHQATLDAIQELQPKVEEASAQLADAKRGREEDDENGRAIKLQRVADLAKRKTTLEAELEVLKENDPAALADLEKELRLVTQAAHRWTDNIFECKSYLVKKRGVDKKQANKMLGITDNFDCKFFACGMQKSWHKLISIGCPG